MKSVVLGLAVIFAGCGAEAGLGGKGEKGSAASPTDTKPGVQSTTPPHSMYVADVAGLPACSAESEGWLVYVKADSKFKACLTAAWTDVAVASENKIVASIGCSGVMEGTSIAFNYSVAQMSSGDVFVSGSIADYLFQASATNFFSSQQVGAATAPVFITMDESGAATSGFWQISLDRATLVTTINYTDSDGPMSWTMTPDKCVANAY